MMQMMVPSVPEAEIRHLYQRYAHVIHHRARTLLGSDEEAADAVHETFARVIRNYEQFRQEASPLTWMYRISTNWCLNRLRDRRGHSRKQENHREEIVGDGIHQEDPAAPMDHQVLHRLIAEADEETREIVLYLYFDEMTREEAAKMVGISVPTLRKRLDLFFKRARKTLGIELAILLLGVLL